VGVLQEIESIHRACAARSDLIGLAGGLPDSRLFPRVAMHTAMAKVMRDPSLRGLQYGWPEGDGVLRAWIASRLSTALRRIDASDVIVTAGAQQAIALATEALTKDGSTVGVEPATYPAALELFRTRGLVLTDAPRADVFYLMPEVGNPAGLPIDSYFAARVRERSAPVIADDAYAELRFDGIWSNASGFFPSVWRVGTFAKTLCPGLRIGYIVPPPEHRAMVLRLKHGADLQASGLSQAILVELLRRFDYDAHMRLTRLVYARRADALVTALRRHLPSWRFVEPDGGFSIFVDTGVRGDDVGFLEVASAHGVSFDPGRIFRVQPHETIELRVCFSGADEELLEEGARRLARAWRAFTAGSRASARRASGSVRWSRR
jgi:2-aminoadipate transaminase